MKEGTNMRLLKDVIPREFNKADLIEVIFQKMEGINGIINNLHRLNPEIINWLSTVFYVSRCSLECLGWNINISETVSKENFLLVVHTTDYYVATIDEIEMTANGKYVIKEESGNSISFKVKIPHIEEMILENCNHA